jgi:hypothetical protein
MCSSNSSAARYPGGNFFLNTLTQLGVGAMAASQLADVLAAVPEPERQLVLDDVSGGRITCETLKLWDVKYVFGNTGAYEAGFVDALVDFPDIHYVLGLQEGSVMALRPHYRPDIVRQYSFDHRHRQCTRADRQCLGGQLARGRIRGNERTQW